jgi:hypothetical protein
MSVCVWKKLLYNFQKEELQAPMFMGKKHGVPWGFVMKSVDFE